MENLTFNRVIDLIKERHGLKSDYAVCKAFDLSPQNVSGWRKERSYPDEKMCGILAQAAGIDPLVLAASMRSWPRSRAGRVMPSWCSSWLPKPPTGEGRPVPSFAGMENPHFCATGSAPSSCR